MPPHDPASHVRVRNLWLSFNPNYLHNKLSSVVEGSAPAWSYYTVKYYHSGASEASEEDCLVPTAGDPSGGWGLAGCQDAGATGGRWGRWEHVKACLSERRGSGVKVPSSQAAKHEWIWSNVHEYCIGWYLSLLTYFFLSSTLTFFFSSTLIFYFFFLVFISVFLSCFGLSDDITSFTQRDSKSYLKVACPKAFAVLHRASKRKGPNHKTPIMQQ